VILHIAWVTSWSGNVSLLDPPSNTLHASSVRPSRTLFSSNPFHQMHGMMHDLMRMPCHSLDLRGDRIELNMSSILRKWKGSGTQITTGAEKHKIDIRSLNEEVVYCQVWVPRSRCLSMLNVCGRHVSFNKKWVGYLIIIILTNLITHF
jgi:hypothetical protein